MNDTLKPCGHRWGVQHDAKVKKYAKKWGCKEAEAFRKMIEEYK